MQSISHRESRFDRVSEHGFTAAAMSAPSIFYALCQWTFVLALGAASCHANAAAAEALPTDSVFAPDSFWYSPIPKEAPLHADSAAFVGEFLRQKKSYYGNVNINTRSYASPVYVVDADAPVTQVMIRRD